jgi:hypothetical protein
MHLKAEINWHRLFHELIEDFDETALTARQRAALEKAGVPLPAEQADASTHVARPRKVTARRKRPEDPS